MDIQLRTPGYSGVWTLRLVDGNPQEITSWGECVEESGRGDGIYLSRKFKGKVYSSCVTPAYLLVPETTTMRVKQHEKFQING